MVLLTLFFLGILFMALVSASLAKEAITLKSKRYICQIRVDYGQKDSTIVSIQTRRKKNDPLQKSSVRFPGFVEIKGVLDFCGPNSGALIAIYRNGSRGFMRYEVFNIDPRTAKLRKIPGLSREIPDGGIVPDVGGFFVFSGVRYSVAYFQDGHVVEKKPLGAIARKDLPAVIFSLQGDGEIETYPPDLSTSGVRVSNGQRLYFLRNDLREPLEEIRCEGLAMELPPDEPFARTFPTKGRGMIFMEIERKIIKIPLTVE
jgi:hypothetical protein